MNGTADIELTDIVSLIYGPQKEGLKMKGTIRPISREAKCPNCGKRYQHFPKLGYVCPACKTTPKRFYIDIFWQGQRPRICSDATGQPLDSYERAYNLLSKIRAEMDEHSFDPTKYVASDLKNFWTSTLLDKYLAEKIPLLAPSCQKDYKGYIRAAKEYFCTTDVREIKKSHLVGYKKFVEKEYRPKGKTTKEIRKGKTVKNYVDAFKTFLRHLKNELEVIPLVPAFPNIEVEDFEWKWIDAETQSALLSATPEEDRPIIMFLMLHGCRPGEARALRCNDVDVKNGSIRIASTFSGKELRNKRKGRRSKIVIIPIHPEFYDYLAERVANNLPEAFVFTNPRTGTHYSESAIQRVWASVRKKAAISKDLRLYDASRHSFASQLVNCDISLLSVSRLLGHSSTRMTEKYAHSKIEKLRSDIANLSLKKGKAEVVSLNKKMA